jgi:hypothetical protein
MFLLVSNEWIAHAITAMGITSEASPEDPKDPPKKQNMSDPTLKGEGGPESESESGFQSESRSESIHFLNHFQKPVQVQKCSSLCLCAHMHV